MGGYEYHRGTVETHRETVGNTSETYGGTIGNPLEHHWLGSTINYWKPLENAHPSLCSSAFLEISSNSLEKP